MIALDTNILVFAHREGTAEHLLAVKWLKHLARGKAPWAVPVFTLGEFLRVVTHPRIFDPPSSIDQALGAVEALTRSPGLRVLTPGPRYPSLFLEAMKVARATGNLAFDAQIAALCREHGVSRLLTTDRDFSRFPWLDILDLKEDPARYH